MQETLSQVYQLDDYARVTLLFQEVRFTFRLGKIIPNDRRAKEILALQCILEAPQFGFAIDFDAFEPSSFDCSSCAGLRERFCDSLAAVAE